MKQCCRLALRDLVFLTHFFNHSISEERLSALSHQQGIIHIVESLAPANPNMATGLPSTVKPHANPLGADHQSSPSAELRKPPTSHVFPGVEMHQGVHQPEASACMLECAGSIVREATFRWDRPS
jgi:hypothetical protein